MSLSVSAAILAGGENRRFNGIIKANILLKEKTFISGIIEAIKGIFDEILIVTNTPENFTQYSDCQIILDIIKNKGPIGGIHAALKKSANEAVFIMACDMPFPDRKIIQMLIENFFENRSGILVPVVKKKIEPLHAIYSVSILPGLEAFISDDKNYSVYEFLSKADARFLQMKNTKEVRTAFTNINNPSDLNQLNSR